MDENVIIVGKLDDKELRDSIESLIKTVKSGTETMATSFETAMGKMSDALGRLKTASGDFNTESGKRVSSTKSETQANNELAASYDRVAQAQQKAVGGVSPAAESYQTFVKNMRENVALLAMEIKSMPSVSLDRQFGAYMQYEAQIEQVRQRIAELRQQMQEMANDPNASRLVKKQNLEEIGSLEQKIVQLEREQITVTQQIASADKQVMAEKQARYEKEKQELIALSIGQREKISFAEQEASAQGKVTEEIRKQAQAIRESQSFKATGMATLDNGYVVYDVGVARNKLSIEEQLLNIEKQKGEETFKRTLQEQREQLEKRATTQATQEQLKVEQQITNEQQKRASSTKPKTFTEYHDLRDAVAHVLKTQRSEITIADEENASYKRLKATITQLTSAYQSLTASERNSDMGKTLALQIQKTTQAAQELQKQMSRPINLDSALRASENSLDNIAKKIQQLSAYRQGIKLTDPKAEQEIQQVNREIERLTKKQRELMGTNRALANSNGALERSFNYMKNRLAFYFTVGASTQFIKNLVEIRGQYEMLEKSIGVLVDSAEQGSKIFNELSQMALVSPYTLLELGAAAKQLVAYDIAGKDVVDTTRRIADMAAAVGVPIERLTYALGQIKAYGYLNARDQRMFANAGIPLAAKLAEYYSEIEGRLVSTGDVYDRIKHKLVSYADVMRVIVTMTDEGGKFFDFQAKMADTLKVKLANLNLAWNDMLNDIGKSNSKLISAPIEGLKSLFLNWKNIEKAIWDLIFAFGVYKAVQTIVILNTTRMNHALLSSNMILGRKLTSSIMSAGKAFMSFATSAQGLAAIIAFAVVDTIQVIKNASDKLAEFNRNLRDNARESVKDIDDFLVSIRKNIENLNNVDASPQEAEKTWKSIKEQIEKAAASSKEIVAALEEKSSWGDKINYGTSILQDIRDVRAAMQELDDQTILVSQEYSSWSNLWMGQDGLVQNAKDYSNALKGTVDIWKSARESAYSIIPVFGLIMNSARLFGDNDFDKFREDIDKFTSSIAQWNASKQFNPLQEWESLLLNTQELINKSDMDYTTQVQTRIAAEKSYIDQRHKMFLQELGSEGEAQFQSWLSQFGTGKQLQREFYDWMQRNHRSTLMSMFKDRNIEEIKSYDWSSKEGQEFLRKMAKQFAEQSHTSFNELWRLINKTNSMSIEIPIILSVEEEFKSTYQYLNELDQKAEEAYSTIQRLQTALSGGKLGALRTLSARMELSAAQTRYNEAIAAGGRSRSAEAEAKRGQRSADAAARKQQAAANRAARQEESALTQALKMELDMVNELRSSYEKLRKAGVSASDASEMILDGYENTIEHINSILGKYGVKAFNISDFVGDNVNLTKLYFTLNNILEKVKKRAQPKEVEELEKYLRKLNVDETVLRYEKIADSINAQFEKLKNEYELAIELDAEPQLGEMFKSVFNIEDLSELPQNWHQLDAEFKKIAEDYLLKAEIIKKANTEAIGSTEEFVWASETNLSQASVQYNKSLLDFFEGIDVLSSRFGLEKGGKGYEIFKSLIEYLKNARKKEESETIKTFNNILEKAGDYEYKMSKILEEASKNRLAIITRWGTSVQGAQGRGLYERLLQSTSTDERKSIAGEIESIANEVAKNEPKLRALLAAILADTYEAESALTDWSKLLEKYGELQVKLTQIVRESAQEQLGVIRRFGTQEEAAEALNLVSLLKIEDDPATVRRLQNDITSLLQKVIERTGDSRAANVSTAITNKAMNMTAKAYWDDFKDSELYAATFDEMGNVSTRAIKAIMDALDKLKEKVGEDPASMKALMKAYNDAQDELIQRKPFESIITSLNEWRAAAHAVKDAQTELNNAVTARAAAKQRLNEIQARRESEERRGFVTLNTHEAETRALAEYEKANKRVKQAELGVINAESAATKARRKVISSLEASAQALENVSGLLNKFNELLGIAEDSEVGIMVNSMAEGFSTLSSVLTTVVAISEVAKTSFGWVAVVATALSVFVGLLNFASNHNNEKINKQIEASERAVKRLENAYKELEFAVEQAYGTVVTGLKKATVANKEFQLAELKRQLILEQSRSKKNQDKDRILDLQGQIIDLEQEIAKASRDVVNDLLDISSVSDFAETLVNDMISAFREGEDYMEKFRDSFADMVQNMIMKAIVSKVIGDRMQALFNEMDAMLDTATRREAEDYANAKNTATWAKTATDKDVAKMLRDMSDAERARLLQSVGYSAAQIAALQNQFDTHGYERYTRGVAQQVRDFLMGANIENALKALNQATEDVYPTLIDYVFGKIPEITKGVDNDFSAAMEKLGDYLSFAETEKELSALQQGIQGITEETAGALEAYMNGISQQVYLQSDLLRQINTTLQGFDMDVQTANNAKMLLQLQQSYSVQLAIQSTLENWKSADGRAVRVEMI